MSISCNTSFGTLWSPSNVQNGLLYNAFSMKDVRELTPEGWHIPTEAEWDVLALYCGGYDVAGGKLRANSKMNWNRSLYYSVISNDEYQFSSFGSGYRSGDEYNPNNISFYNAGSEIMLATYPTYDYDPDNPFLWTLYYIYHNNDSLGIVINATPYQNGVSVRCIRDTAVGWVSDEKVKDYDNNVYSTIQIGTQIWLRQNLATIHYNNGDGINYVSDVGQWMVTTTGAYCFNSVEPIPPFI